MKNDNQNFKLTHPQQRVWYSEKLHPGTGMWNNAGTMKIKGRIDYPLLERSLNAFIEDNESARIQIGIKDGTPYQYIAKYTPFRLDVLDFSNKDISELYEWDSIQVQAPMPLIDSRLYFFALIKIGENEAAMFAKFHHIISDAISLVDFSNQFVENYQNLLNGKETIKHEHYSYINFVHDEVEYLDSNRFKNDHLFWNDLFTHLPEPTIIKQKKSNYTSVKARRKAYVAPQKLSNQIREYCEKHGISIFTLFFSALAIYIYRITNKKDIIIGAPVSNRTSVHAKNAFGMYISTVPIRIAIDDSLTFKDFAQAVFKNWFSALRHQRYPYDVLLQDLRKTQKGLDSLYDITFSYQIGKFHKNTEQFTFEGRWHFNGYQANTLSIHVNDREDYGRFIIDYDYQTPLYSIKEIEYIHNHIINIVQDMIDHPQKTLFELDILSVEESDRILVKFNDTKYPFPQNETLIDMWNKCMEKVPKESVAIISQEHSLTYDELDKRSTMLASYLQKKGVGPDQIVGLLAGRSADYCVSILAVLKAGGAFLPIDPDLPSDRIAYMLKDSNVKVLLVSPHLTDKCPEHNGLCIVQTNHIYHDKGLKMANDSAAPNHLAYVIYTSGSTGQPKGVQIEHQSIVHFIYSLSEIWDLSPGARLLCAGSISFDISMMEVFPALLSGLVLVLASENEVNIPRNMVKLIEKNGVNIMMLTPGRMELLLSDKDGAACIRNFRNIGLGGDVLPVKLLERVQANTKAHITNFYGPTEITVAATCADVTHATVPNIGKPMFNVKAYILDEHKNPVPIGIPGELYLGGKGLARGYINKPELSRERFVDNPVAPGEKLYRTGDLARWYPLGEIEFLGRIDQQVKIRGYRVELGEIENRLLQIPGITACVVTDYADSTGYKFLCAYLCGQPPKKSEIKAYLTRDLPGYMIPSYFITIESIPFNTSGKVDKNRLPEPAGEMIDENFDPPKTPTEQTLAQIWGKVLSIQQVGRDDSFFDIGGDSLSIVRVMSEVLETFKVEISLEEVYRFPCLKDFAALIEDAEEVSFHPILSTPKKRYYPVSVAQQQMWILSNDKNISKAYNIPIAFELRGKIDLKRLSNAFNKLIERHASLRTFFELKNGELVQKIESKVTFDLQQVKCDEKKLQSVLKSLLHPFDLQQAPLFRATIVELYEDHHVLLIDIHHIIGDMRSIEILMKELSDYYHLRNLLPKEIDYKDYAIWQREFLQSASAQKQCEYWKTALSGELPMLNLHTAPRPSVKTFSGARQNFKIENDRLQKLRSFAQQKGATLFMAALAAYNVLLFKYTGQEDIIVGTPVENRTRPEIQNTVGIFINTLPMRNYPRGNESFSEFFQSVCKNSIEAFSHAEYPLENIIASISPARDTSRNPLFDTMLVQAKGSLDLKLNEAQSRYIMFDPGIAKLDLTLEIYESENELLCEFEYNTKLFKKASIERMSNHLRRLFEILVELPETLLRDVQILTDEELYQVTQGFNRTDAAFDETISIQSILRGLSDLQGEKEALVVNGQSMAFKELNIRSNQIAHWLKIKGVGRNTIVALCIGRSFDMVAGLLAILKAGGAYLPLDPSYPDERISFMLSDSGAAILLADGEYGFSFDGEFLNIQDMPKDLPVSDVVSINDMEDGAYVIYTSGSTGIPKGAILPLRALFNLMEGTKSTIRYDQSQTSISVTTVSFDIFVIDALLPLLFGCTVVLCNEEELRQPHLLAQLIEKEDVKFIQTTPTRMRLLMDDASFCAAVIKHIQKIVLGGEEFPLSLLRHLKRHTNAQIISGYGPTETTVYCTFKDLTNTLHVTIGRPIVNTRMYILDRYRKPVPVGVLGEAYISGACVTTGYINRDILNKEKLIPDPYWPGHTMYQSGDICAFLENGEMEIRGRVDHQVKIRGLRIELGEIEAALREIIGVDDAVVQVLDEGANKYLCAYYEAGNAIDTVTLQAYLNKRLPAYMIPSYFIHLQKFPLTLNGKVNRKALPLPDKNKLLKNSAGRDEPLTKTEKKMARVWENVLKVSGIGPYDSFFDLGGDSLCVIKVQASILQYGWNLRTQDFYNHKTLRAVCGCINKKETEQRVYKVKDKLDLHILKNRKLKEVKFENILITGATGYLGAHILSEIVEKTHTNILCLIRGKNEVDCVLRLRNVLAFYFGLERSEEILLRVKVVKGNVTAFNLGTDAEAYQRICREVDTIIHCAAITDHVGKPEIFYKTNVLGTKMITSFARAAKAVLLYISTVSVSGTCFVENQDQTGEFTEDCYYIGQNYNDNEYVKSKFIAEGIVLKAMEKDLNARIFRVGVLTGRISDGKFQLRAEKNAFANQIKAFCALGYAPAGMLDTKLEMTPVDSCAQAILTLSSISDQNRPVYHLFNTNELTFKDVISLLNKNGYMIRTIPDDEFYKRIQLLSKRGRLNAVSGMMDVLTEDFSSQKINITANATAGLLKKASFSWPLIDAEYMGKYVKGINGK